MASGNHILGAEVLSKQIEVKKETVDKTRDDIEFKRNVTRDDSVTCGCCQGRGHSTDKLVCRLA